MNKLKMQSSTASILHLAQKSSLKKAQAQPTPAAIAKQYAVDRHNAGDFRTYVLVNSKEEEQALVAKKNYQLPKINIEQEGESIPGVSIKVAGQSKRKIVLTLGCQGEANATQRSVADLLEKVVVRLQSQDYIVACVLVGGDNVYNNGADAPDSNDIKKCCEDIYTTARTPNLAKIPFFYIQGNHDQNRHRASYGKTGEDIGLNQVAHSLLPGPKYKTVQEKIDLYSRKLHPDDEFYILNAQDCEHYNMMGLTYSIIVDDMRFFCMDSNTFVTDAMDRRNGRPKTQVEWLLKNYVRSVIDGYKNILDFHCPPITVCKRKFGNDLHLYEDAAHRQGKEGSYNREIKTELDILNLILNAIISAHDHGISYFNDGIYRLIVSAGGGAKPHPQLSVEENEYLASYFEKNGIVLVSSDPNDKFKLDFAIYLTDTKDYPLMFDNLSTTPVRFFTTPEEKIRMEELCLARPEVVARYTKPKNAREYHHVRLLCQAARHGIHEFMQVMNANTNKDKKGRPALNHREMKFAHDLLAYISSPYIEDFDTTLVNIGGIVDLPAPFAEDTLNAQIAQAYQRLFHVKMWPKYLESVERKKASDKTLQLNVNHSF